MKFLSVALLSALAPPSLGADKWYPKSNTDWAEGYCVERSDDGSGSYGPGYDTELACCKNRYGAQQSGKCLSMLEAPPTVAPTGSGGLDLYYPDYDTAWSEASCKNERPLPSGRPTYPSLLACCKGAYAGQQSGNCLSELDSPPTTSPTGTGGADFFYPDYEEAWAEATCKNDLPLPFGPGGRPTYDSMLDCCKGAYSGQASGACLAALDSPPTTSPTSTGGLDFYYPDYDSAWAEATCKNDRPLPFTPNSRPSYDTMLECCKGAYAGQESGACLAALDSPPTTSPTDTGGFDFFYPDYESTWSEATCKNDRPLPFALGGRPTFDTKLDCCKGAYAGQASGACLADLDSPPTTSPTTAGGLDLYYPDYEKAWDEGHCINDRPLPNGRPAYDSMLDCCNGAYGGQTSGKCISELDSPPTTSPTDTGGFDFYYPDYDTLWSEATCKNERPLPFTPNSRPTYDTMLECCKGAYAGQQSGACLAALASPPTTAPTASGGLDAYYPRWDLPRNDGVCSNERPLPVGRTTSDTKEACCKAHYGDQFSQTCMCDVNACHSCKCPDSQDKTDCIDAGTLTCE